jgi:hypothetical protein
MSAKAWKPVRLTEDTMHKLEAVRAILLRGHEQGKRTLSFGPKGELPNNVIVDLLANHFLSHNARSRR